MATVPTPAKKAVEVRMALLLDVRPGNAVRAAMFRPARDALEHE
jgi:hypothetical protein